MPKTKIIFFLDSDGTAPVLNWIDTIPARAQEKIYVRIERLGELGYALQRPEAEYLDNDIYELRVSLNHVQYRLLYFFHDKKAILCSSLIKKGKKVPTNAIKEAARIKEIYKSNPILHTYKEDIEP